MERAKRVKLKAINFLLRSTLIGVVLLPVGIIGCSMSRQIGGTFNNQPRETKSSIQELTNAILSASHSKSEIISKFEENGFTKGEQSNDTFRMYKTANSGTMHFSIRIVETPDGFFCSEILARGIGL